MAVWQGARLLRTLWFLAQCRPITDPQTVALWQAVAARSPLRDRVRLLTALDVHCPCCWGLLRPRLVLPADFRGCDPNALRWSFRHELVHLERGDAWTGLGQTLLLTMHWYHPTAWWLSRQLNWWREVSCDRVVVQRAGQRRSYALALVRFTESSVQTVRRLRPTFLHLAGLLSQLQDRLQMLSQGDPPSSEGHRVLTWSMALATLGLIAAGQLGATAIVPHESAREASLPPVEGHHRLQRLEEIRVIHSEGRQ
jgi:D-alanyl-D-alanine endopeptidase (penicillin-binding protein 7)